MVERFLRRVWRFAKRVGRKTRIEKQYKVVITARNTSVVFRSVFARDNQEGFALFEVCRRVAADN